MIFATSKWEETLTESRLFLPKRTNKRLAEQLGKDPATVSKWCSNVAQLNLETLLQVAKHLEVEVQELPVKQ